MNFKDILSEKSVFINKDALSVHYLPERIIHREKEIEKIMRVVAPVFKNKRPNNVFIYGKSGTGKTSSVKSIIKQFKELPSNGTINYINCRMYNTRYKILQKLANDIVGFSKNGFPPSHFYERIMSWINNGNRFLTIVLDEIDIIKDLNELIYTLTRANDEIRTGGISIIGISNRIDFKDKLDNRSRSALLESEVVFPPYNSEQLKEILAYRANLGFSENSCDTSAINLAAAIAARETGDARYALKLLMYAGEIADEKKDDMVTYRHVEDARKNVEKDLVMEAVATLPEHQQLVLYSLSILSINGSKYHKLGENQEDLFMMGELYESYKHICKDLKREARSSRWCKEYIRELESLGLVATVGSGKGIRGHSTLIKLLYSKDWIKRTVEGMLLH